MRGKIVKINKEGGWGFISSHEKPFTRIFFHWTAIKSNLVNVLELDKGMEVDFELLELPDKGWRAIKIELVDDKAIREAEIERIK